VGVRRLKPCGEEDLRYWTGVGVMCIMTPEFHNGISQGSFSLHALALQYRGFGLPLWKFNSAIKQKLL
jgi:hypothetical protein